MTKTKMKAKEKLFVEKWPQTFYRIIEFLLSATVERVGVSRMRDFLIENGCFNCLTKDRFKDYDFFLYIEKYISSLRLSP